MKRKITCFLILSILISTCFAAAQINIGSLDKNKLTSLYHTMDDDVPIWNEGDSWTYKVDTLDIDIEQNNQTIIVHLEMDQLPLTVKDTSGGLYTVDFTTAIEGTLNAHVIKEGDIFDIDGSLVDTTITGTIYYEQTSLGFSELTGVIDGRMMLNIQQNGQSLLPFTLPIKAKISFDMYLTEPYNLVQFPINTSSYWGLPGTNIYLDGTIESIWLYIIDFIDTLLVSIGFNPIVPPEYKPLLPIIDISDALNVTGFVMPFVVPEIPILFTCFDMDNVTVAAGTFDAYNISMFDGLGTLYYAPAVKNILKIQGDFGEELPFISNIQMELIETNVV